MLTPCHAVVVPPSARSKLRASLEQSAPIREGRWWCSMRAAQRVSTDLAGSRSRPPESARLTFPTSRCAAQRKLNAHSNGTRHV